MLFNMYILGVVLVMVVYLVFLLASEKMNEEENLWSPFECGFDPSVSTRKTFSYKFFVVAVLFLIFDVEIALLLPVPMMVESVFVQLWYIVFMSMLIVGLGYEIGLGVLKWVDNDFPKA